MASLIAPADIASLYKVAVSKPNMTSQDAAIAYGTALVALTLLEFDDFEPAIEGLPLAAFDRLSGHCLNGQDEANRKRIPMSTIRLQISQVSPTPQKVAGNQSLSRGKKSR